MHGVTSVKSIIGTRETCPGPKSGRRSRWGEYSYWKSQWRGWTSDGWDGFRTRYYDGTNDGCGGTNAATASSTAATAATTTNAVWTAAATTATTITTHI